MIDPLDLHALADGQAAPEQREALMKEMAESEQSAAEFRSITLLKECVQTRAEKYDCEASWKKCVSRLNEIDKANRVEGFVGRYAWGLCALLFLVIVGSGYLNRLSGYSLGTHDIGRYAAEMLPIKTPNSKDSAEVRQWMNKVLGSVLTDVKPERMQIVGAGKCVIEGHRAFCFDLQDNPNVAPVRLMVIQNVESIDGTPMDGSGNYYSTKDTLIWQDGNNAMVLMGSRTPDELKSIAERLTVRR